VTFGIPRRIAGLSAQMRWWQGMELIEVGADGEGGLGGGGDYARDLLAFGVQAIERYGQGRRVC
jgi:hypothetical protein